MSNNKKNKNQQIVLFNLDEQYYALSLTSVERVISIVEITSLPKISEIVMGVINFHGEVIQVVNIRKLFNLPVREIGLDDQLIITQISKQRVALIVDSVIGIHELERSQVTDTDEAFSCSDYLTGIAKIENNIVMVLDEQKIMEEAINAG
jgi:purine-binding chemotaxis protein CheW